MKTLPIVSAIVFAGISITAFAIISCGDDKAKVDPDARPIPDATASVDDAGVPLRCDAIAGTDITLQEIVRGLVDPLLLTAPADDERLFVVEQPGKIRIIEENTLVPTPFLDIQDIVRDNSNEQGLLGLTFHPNYASNGKFYVNYTASSPQGATVVAEYTVSADANVANTAGRILVSFAQPFSNHNGGMLAFGPDGYLYIGTGDGGSGDDPQNNGQNLDTLLGKLLRIDVNSGDPYAIPADNPFVAGGGLPEIWAYGLRNPWRFSFDRLNGDIYIADVGQGTLEEVNVESKDAAGLNYGWKIAEGKQCRGGGNNCDMTGLTPPVHDYGRDDGQSITGGYVYRGECMPDVQGMYFFGDYVTERIWTFNYQGDGAIANHTDRTAVIDPNSDIDGLTSFGEDAFGELYVISRDGKVFKLIPKPAK